MISEAGSKVTERTHALLAELSSPDALIEAARTLRSAGYTQLEAFTPIDIEGLDEALGLARPRLIPASVLFAGLLGLVVSITIQQWTGAVDFPLDVGGRPLSSWPAYMPIAFETTVLFAAFAAFVSPLLLSRMPRLWHPLFEVDGVESATVDGYWIAVAVTESDDGRCRGMIDALNARRVVIAPLEAMQ